MTERRLGLVVNPIAGMGGRVGLHGTDGDTVAAALARGARSVTGPRAARALARLRSAMGEGGVTVATAGEDMGARQVDDARMPYVVVHQPCAPATADDTRATVRKLVDSDVDALMVVGGDGTLRDVLEGLAGRGTPVIGVPSGVKMHSSAFAMTPEAAGDIAARFLAAPEEVGVRDAEIIDRIDDRPTLLGVLNTPAVSDRMQAAKSVVTVADDDAALTELGRVIAGEMQPGRLYLLGPGSSVGRICQALGLEKSALGVDAVLDGQLIGRDLGEAEILALLDRHPRATLVLGVVGGQGFLLGRGNQQLSAAVIDAVGPDNVEIIAARNKLAMLHPPVLRIDVGDAQGIAPLRGYRRVRVAVSHSTVLEIVS